MGKTLAAIVIGTGLLLATVPMEAHHAFTAEFDASKPVQLRGTVTKFDWINPHSWIYMDVKKPDGSVVNWAIEGGSPNTLVRRGFTKSSLPVGTEIVVDAYMAKDGSNHANGQNITLANGNKLFLGSSIPTDVEKKK
jgi:hypothetical protein